MLVGVSEPVRKPAAGAVVVRTTEGGVAVPATVSFNATTQSVIVNPVDSLAAATSYTVEVTPTGLADLAGNPVAAEQWTFTTR